MFLLFRPSLLPFDPVEMLGITCSITLLRFLIVLQEAVDDTFSACGIPLCL